MPPGRERFSADEPDSGGLGNLLLWMFFGFGLAIALAGLAAAVIAGITADPVRVMDTPHTHGSVGWANHAR